MKTNMTKNLAAAVTLGILSSVPCFADEPQADGEKETTKALIEALEAAGLDDQAVAEVRKSIEGKAGKENGDATVKVFRKAVIMGPDGTLRTLNDDEMDGVDLGKGLLKQLKQCENGGDGGAVKVAGKVSIVGPDGKVKTMDLDFGDELDLGGILKEAMKGLDLDDIDADAGVFGIGPGILVQPGAPKEDTTKAELVELRKELAKQRKLLEKILSKLE